MGLCTGAFLIAILFLGSTCGTSEEDLSPAKLSKSLLYPKKYVPMDLKKYREAVTELPTTSTSQPEITSSTVQPEAFGSTETPQTGSEELTDLTASDEELLEAMRSKKSATTTFCVEIRPSNPYQKPFQVCEPAVQPHPHYVYRPPPRPQPHPQPQPVKYPQQPPRYVPQPQYPPQQPQYAPQPSYNQPQPPPPPQPQQEYSRPVMVLPHVPVAQPYHVSKPSYKPQTSGVYRTSDFTAEDVAVNPEEIDTNMEGRSAYYNTYDGYGEEKNPIYDYHKRKDISYVPIITHSVSKTKPMKFLKVLKDLKKDKYKFDDDEYYRPIYRPPSHSYGHQESGYGHHESGYGQQESGYGHEESSGFGHIRKEGGSSHGLVITCQPSAVGYTGQQNQMELSKHMDLLKNIYSQSEKLYNQQALSSNSVGEGIGVSGGYVSPGTYRSSGGDWKGVKSGGGWNQAEENMRKSGGEGWNKLDADPTVGSSGGGGGGGWIADPTARSSDSGGWGAEADPNLMKSHSKGGGYQPIDESALRSHSKGGDYQQIDDSALRTHSKGTGYQQMEGALPRSSHSKKGGGYQAANDQVGLGLSSSSSAGPNPTMRMMSPNEMDTTAAFRNAQQNVAIRNQM